MNKIVTLLVTVFCISASQFGWAEQGALFVFSTKGAVHLRWNAPMEQAYAGFHVERKRGGNWQRLTEQPVTRITEVKEIRAILGASADAFLTFFDPRLKTIGQAEFDKLASDPIARGMVQLFSVKNADFAKVLGETYVDTDIEAGAKAEYRIVLMRPNGGEQSWAESVTVTQGDAQQVMVPKALVGKAGDGSVLLNWEHNPALSRSGELVGYRIYRAQKPFGPFQSAYAGNLVPTKIDGKLPEFLFANQYLTNGTPYWFYITGVNLLGFESKPSETIQLTPKDMRPPKPPILQARLLGDHTLLEWAAVTDDDLAGYRVYRADSFEGPYEPYWPAEEHEANASLSYLDRQIDEGAVRWYYVTSEDSSGNVSRPSNVVEVFRKDLTPPATPVQVKAVADEKQGIKLGWTNNTEADLAGYLVERTTNISGKGKAAKADSQFFVLNADPLTANAYIDSVPPTSQSRYAYRVVAIDKAWNRSEPSEVVIARMPDKVPPRPPVLVDAKLEGETVTLRWQNSIEEDLAGYRVARLANDKEGFLALGREMVAANQNTFQDKPEQIGVTYQYRMTAVDESGNESQPSAPIKVLLLDLTPPQLPAGLKVEQVDEGVQVSWQRSQSRDLQRVLVYRRTGDNQKVRLVGDLNADAVTMIDGEVKQDTLYHYSLRVIDTVGNESERGAEVSLRVGESKASR